MKNITAKSLTKDQHLVFNTNHTTMNHQKVTPAENIGFKDNNNCTIVALSTAAGIPYTEAYKIGEQSGRKHGKGFYTAKLMETARKNGIEYRKIKTGGITVQKFLQKYPTGRYVVNRRDHAFAIIDGTIYDHLQNKPMQRIIGIWNVQSKRLDTIKSLCNS